MADSASPAAAAPATAARPIRYARYAGEDDIPKIMGLVDTELSEPYNWYTYRYFLQDWPHLCFMAYDGDVPIGTIVCKQEQHRDKLERGYLAMLSTKEGYRGRGVATQLARLALTSMLTSSPPAQEAVLETEVDNEGAMSLYRKLGFVKEKRLHRFYLNAKDAYRLKLPLPALDSLGLTKVAAQAEVENVLAGTH